MLDKLTDSMQFSAEALKLRARRQEVLTSNISNVDTPNYKAIDFKFEDALKAATGEKGSMGTPAQPSLGNGAGGLAVTHKGHITGKGNAGQSTAEMLQFRRGNNAAIDGNTVDIERERAAFAENTVKYEAALRAINGRISTLKQAMGSGNQ
ncbi:flagellar basal-body rod protein FlgB [Limnobacter thiooxidans]|uniref:Flagellar basal body rod protein FlgB n=1 Tax=Limnobacter thiooxidans TaxID=131080 RepID=A0AA86M8A9_9BURK|nr:flagellar basal-body rod protein FlgB [Limnobacter thiooxidans]BET25559.1 flagellar basal body rod protein FlgB [Limnobacter thiooxidans]